MAKRKADVRIGYRAAEEALRLSGYSASHAALLIGCSHKLIYTWAEGNAPNAIFMQRLLELGADVTYILSGRRCANAAA